MSDFRPVYVREGERLAREILDAGYDSEFERESAWVAQVEDDFLEGLWTSWEKEQLLKQGFRAFVDRWDNPSRTD